MGLYIGQKNVLFFCMRDKKGLLLVRSEQSYSLHKGKKTHRTPTPTYHLVRPYMVQCGCWIASAACVCVGGGPDLGDSTGCIFKFAARLLLANYVLLIAQQ